MGWTEFFKYLASGYLLYYGILIVLDLLKPQSGALILEEEDLLQFPEDNQATVVEEDGVSEVETPNSPQNLNQETHLELFRENINASTGGVNSMTELFRLAHDETIEVKKNLVY